MARKRNPQTTALDDAATQLHDMLRTLSLPVQVIPVGGRDSENAKPDYAEFIAMPREVCGADEIAGARTTLLLRAVSRVAASLEGALRDGIPLPSIDLRLWCAVLPNTDEDSVEVHVGMTLTIVCGDRHLGPPARLISKLDAMQDDPTFVDSIAAQRFRNLELN